MARGRLEVGRARAPPGDVPFATMSSKKAPRIGNRAHRGRPFACWQASREARVISQPPRDRLAPSHAPGAEPGLGPTGSRAHGHDRAPAPFASVVVGRAGVAPSGARVA